MDWKQNSACLTDNQDTRAGCGVVMSELRKKRQLTGRQGSFSTRASTRSIATLEAGAMDNGFANRMKSRCKADELGPRARGP